MIYEQRYRTVLFVLLLRLDICICRKRLRQQQRQIDELLQMRDQVQNGRAVTNQDLFRALALACDTARRDRTERSGLITAADLLEMRLADSFGYRDQISFREIAESSSSNGVRIITLRHR